MRHVAGELLEVMAPLNKQGKVRILETSRGVSIEINDSILFSPGQALLQPAMVKAMQSVAEVLVAAEFPITIEGIRQHPDQERSVPVELGAFGRSRDRRPALVHRCRRCR